MSRSGDCEGHFGHVYTWCLNLFGLWALHASKGYDFCTSFDEGPSKPKWVGSGDVATSKALIGSKIFFFFFVEGRQRLTMQLQQFLVCLERLCSNLFFDINKLQG